MYIYVNICAACLGSAAYEPTVNQVMVPVLHREQCNDWLVQLNVTEGMICAGYPEGGKDACQVSDEECAASADMDPN